MICVHLILCSAILSSYPDTLSFTLLNQNTSFEEEKYPAWPKIPRRAVVVSSTDRTDSKVCVKTVRSQTQYTLVNLGLVKPGYLMLCISV